MSFTGELEKYEQVVLIHYGTGELVDARSTHDMEMYPGGVALLEVSVVRGLPVESAVVNVNDWDVYKTDDPALVDILLDRVFKKEEQ